ncbi:hypothetical protein ACJX0J_021974, partial [Zea mays]
GTTTATSPSSRPAPSARTPRTPRSPPTRPRRTSPSRSCRPRIPSGSASPSTSPSSTTRSSARRTAPARWPSRPSTKLFQSWIVLGKSRTRIAHSSCSFFVTTSPCGLLTC